MSFAIFLNFKVKFNGFSSILERNLNPKAACLKRREEEKSEDGPKVSQHHLLHQSAYSAISVSFSSDFCEARFLVKLNFQF